MTVYDNVAFAMHIVGASDREIRKSTLCAGSGGLGRKNGQSSAGFPAVKQRVGWPGAGEVKQRMIIADEAYG